jgi:hypothetical protein
VYTNKESGAIMEIPVEMLRTCRCCKFGKRSELVFPAGGHPDTKESQ